MTRPLSELRGLEKLCRLYRAMQCGDVFYVWDYAAEAAVPQSEMPFGSIRWKKSERARFARLQKEAPQP